MWKQTLCSVILSLSWSTLCIFTSATASESLTANLPVPFKRSFESLPQLQSQEREFLKRFWLGTASVKSHEGQSLLKNSRACLEAFEKEISAIAKTDPANFSWHVEQPFAPDTQRPFIPLLDQIHQIALLEIANRMESNEWNSALNLLYHLQWSARLLNREPVLFAQVSSYANEIFCLKIWARYFALCPKPLREKFAKLQQSLPPLGDGRETLNHDRQAAYVACSHIVGLPFPIQNPQALIATLQQAIQNGDRTQLEQRKAAETLSSAILHIEALESKYQRLHALWTGDYVASLSAITELHHEFKKKDHIAFAIHVPYFNFFRKTREPGVYQAMFRVGQSWINHDDLSSKSNSSSKILDPRFHLPFQIEIKTIHQKKRLLVISPGEGNEKLELRFDLN